MTRSLLGLRERRFIKTNTFVCLAPDDMLISALSISPSFAC